MGTLGFFLDQNFSRVPWGSVLSAVRRKARLLLLGVSLKCVLYLGVR